MSNILPQEAQKAVWSMHRARFIVAGSAVAVIAAAISAAALAPSYLTLAVGQGFSPASGGSGSASDQADRDAIIHTQAILGTLAPLVSATTTPTDAVSVTLALRSAGVSVNHITYASGSMIVSGTAAAREAIDAYRQALGADPHFTNASVPVGDLAGAPGGSFTITLSGNF
jgi:hypothetical protein